MKRLSSIKELEFYISRHKVSHFTADLVCEAFPSDYIVRLGLVVGVRFVTLYYSRPLSYRTKNRLVALCRKSGLVGVNF